MPRPKADEGSCVAAGRKVTSNWQGGGVVHTSLLRAYLLRIYPRNSVETVTSRNQGFSLYREGKGGGGGLV